MSLVEEDHDEGHMDLLDHASVGDLSGSIEALLKVSFPFTSVVSAESVHFIFPLPSSASSVFTGRVSSHYGLCIR